MIPIIKTLTKLFNIAERVTLGTGKGLLRHGTGQYAARAVRSLELTLRGTRIAYSDLTAFDKAAVDEAVQYANRFAHEYMDHHDENTAYRIRANSLEEVVTSHAQEIVDAARNALYATMRSHGYDIAFGRAPRVAAFQEEDLLKQMVLAVIMEVVSHLDENADKD